MKKFAMICLFAAMTFGMANAQKKAEIKFDKTTHDFGNFSEANPVVEHTFTFSNLGDAPLIINQAIASCGCTIPEYSKQPIAPGQKGTIKVIYNSKGKIPGHFKKTVTVRTNGEPELVRIYIEGNMTEAQ